VWAEFLDDAEKNNITMPSDCMTFVKEEEE